MKVVIYSRYSPRPEKDGDAERIAADEDAQTIQLQIETCYRYSAMRQLPVTDTIRDPETSARMTPLFDRPAGSQLKFLPPGSHVICSKLDRVFRSTADGLLTMTYFKKHGITMHFADQSGCTLDLSTGDGEFMFTVLLAAASLEPRRTADRTSKAMKARQSNGERMTSKQTIPFGYMLDPDDEDRIIICDEEQRAMKIASEMDRQGASLRAIARKIGPLRGKSLHHNSVQRLIDRYRESHG
jgi:DNA invertase Pin-like site-specific DNA recombinase